MINVYKNKILKIFNKIQCCHLLRGKFHRAFGFVLFAAVIFSFLPLGAIFAEYRTLYVREVKREALSPGVSHEVYYVFTSEGWVAANVVRSSQSATHSVSVLYPNPLQSAEQLSTLASKRDDVVAAINGDFFDYSTKAVLGRIIDAGRVIQTSNRSKEFAHLAVYSDGAVKIGYESGEKTTIGNGSSTFEVYYINKPYSYEGIVTVFDANFGDKSPGKYADNKGETVEILVEGGQITDISGDGKGYALGRGTIAAGDYVVHASGAAAAQIKKAFSVGDEILLTLSKDIADVYTGISGGTQLVKDGAAADFTHNILGEHPRTAVGVEKDGRTLMLVTINGRSNSYRGMRQTELAEFMIKLGAYNALILDGGGSTTMLVKDPYSGERDVVSYLSDGNERYIYNGLALTHTPKQTGVIHSLSLKAPEVSYYSFGEKAAGVVGIPLELRVEALDTGFAHYDVSGRVSFEAIGIEGNFKNGAFVPSKSGDGVIVARADGKEARLDVHISERPVRMYGEMSAPDENGRYGFDFYVETDDGYVAHMPPAALSVYISGDFAKYDSVSGAIVPTKEDYAGYVTFTCYVTNYDVLSLSFAMAEGFLEHRTSLGEAELSSAVQQVCGGAVQAVAPEREGSALKMRYSVAGDETALARRTLSAKFAEPVLLKKSSGRYTIDVYGANQGRVLVQASVIPAEKCGKANAASERKIFPVITNIDWEGWRAVELEFDFDKDYVLDEIVVRKPFVAGMDNNVALSPIYFGDVVSREPQVYDGFLPDELQLVKKYTDYKLSGAEVCSVTYGDGYLSRGYADEDDYKEALKARFHYIEIDNSGGFIRNKNDGAQWASLISQLAAPTKPILIQFSSTYYFRDPLERQLLLELIEKSGKPAVLVFRAYRGETDLFRKNGAFIAELNDDEALCISNGPEFEIRRFK